MDFWVFAKSKNFTKLGEIRDILVSRKFSFSRKYCYSQHFRRNGNKNFCCKRFFENSCKNIWRPGCPVQVSFHSAGWLVQSELSQLFCPSCLVPDVLSKIFCLDPSVLSSCIPVALPRPRFPLFSWCNVHVVAVLSSLFFPCSPSRLTCQANLLRQSCPAWPVLAVLSKRSCMGTCIFTQWWAKLQL